MKDRFTGDMQVDRPVGIADRRNHQERDDDEIRESACEPEVAIEVRVKHRVGVQQQVEGEDRRQREGEGLDRPALLHEANHLLDE